MPGFSSVKLADMPGTAQMERNARQAFRRRKIRAANLKRASFAMASSAIAAGVLTGPAVAGTAASQPRNPVVRHAVHLKIMGLHPRVVFMNPGNIIERSGGLAL